MPQVARWQEGLGGKITIAVVSAGPAEDHRAAAREHGLRELLADEDGAVTADYGITVTPSAVLVGTGPAIAAATAAGASEITALVARVTAGGLAVAGRRALLKRAVAGAAAVTVVPLLASACASARSVRHAMRPGQLKIDGAWLCDQRYALCTSAACEPSKTNPKVSVCRCTVMTGYSVGFKTCEQRAPAGRRLHSNFSLQAVTSSTRVMTCSELGLWVQCLDAVCEADPANPGHALCQCVNMKTKNFLTFAGNCDTRTCASVIWSAATQPFPGGAQYEKGSSASASPTACPRAARPARGRHDRGAPQARDRLTTAARNVTSPAAIQGSRGTAKPPSPRAGRPEHSIWPVPGPSPRTPAAAQIGGTARVTVWPSASLSVMPALDVARGRPRSGPVREIGWRSSRSLVKMLPIQHQDSQAAISCLT